MYSITPPVTYCNKNNTKINLDLRINISKAQRNVVKSKKTASRAMLQSSKLVNKIIDLAFLENDRLIFGSLMKLVCQKNSGKLSNVYYYKISKS